MNRKLALRGRGTIPAKSQGRMDVNFLEANNPGKTITPSFLRLEKEVTGTVSSIDFDTLINQGSVLSTERRLNLPDKFAVTGVSLFISKISSSSAANHATKTLYSFPNAQVFTGSGEADNLMALYNGFLSLRIGGDILIDSMNCYDFYEAGNYQKGVGSSATSNVPVQRDQFKGTRQSRVNFDQVINLDGSKKIQWSITLPTSTSLAGTSSVNTVSMLLSGYLIQDGGKITR